MKFRLQEGPYKEPQTLPVQLFISDFCARIQNASFECVIKGKKSPEGAFGKYTEVGEVIISAKRP